MNETKATHPDLWPGYRVTVDGRVFSVVSNWRGYGERELNQTPNSDGCPSVRLIRDGKRVRLAVHRMVAAAYLPPRPSPQHELRHLDGDQLNNHVSNLAWGTPKDNADDRERHGRTARGEKLSLSIRRSSHREMTPRGDAHYRRQGVITHG